MLDPLVWRTVAASSAGVSYFIDPYYYYRIECKGCTDKSEFVEAGNYYSCYFYFYY